MESKASSGCSLTRGVLHRMRFKLPPVLAFVLGACAGCARPSSPPALAGPTQPAQTSVIDGPVGYQASNQWSGFDRNDYPGDDAMLSLRASFAFTGYWLTNPPGEN